MALVLIVDDEIGILRLLEDVLTDEGHTVVVAVNGRQALEHISNGRPDIVLTDLMMPVMDGAALIEAIGQQPEMAGVPIVLMSSLSESMARDKVQSYTTFVRKPFSIFAYIDLVATLLRTP
ncbi:response regulator [Asticcacaulis sp. YBE204]|uniref:response regulator n=1 Tax=Asticcacaulis sp. YBE204 TaxID=1282363 RepID=UPI0003C408FB|nr:response regulator [Asticcacaulis sp. YBE204]ESQ79422.1 hypothetical protein AEYBE204_10470 [Asticcacaulis sp. YBE204]